MASTAPIPVVLREISPGIADDIAKFCSAPVRDYAANLWKFDVPPTSVLCQKARTSFEEVLEGNLFDILSVNDAKEAMQEFRLHPVIHTGTHTQLILDPVTFHTFVFSLLGAKAANLKNVLISSSSTITFKARAKQGPGWLQIGSTAVNLFGLSNRALSSSVCAYKEPVRFNLRGVEQAARNLGGAGKSAVERVLATLSNVPPTTALEAFQKGNSGLIQLWHREMAPRPIFFDDRFVAAVAIRHIRDDQSILSRLIFDAARRRNLLNNLSRVANDSLYSKFFSRNTDLFWGVRNGRIRTLSCKDGTLIEPNNQQGLIIPLTQESIEEGLKQGALLPDLFLTVLLMSMLPKIRVLGGLRQIGYYPAVKKVLLDCLDTTQHEQELAREIRTTQLNGWGMRVSEPAGPVLEQLGSCHIGRELVDLGKRMGIQSLANGTNDLALFQWHPSWRNS